MNMENKRIFISDLPDSLTKDELESRFSKFGVVSSIEIKKRKEFGPNKYPCFAYVNLVTDNRTLNQCFQDFASNKCAGHYVSLQIAKENFLERLKRERREADKNANHVGLNTATELQKEYTNGDSNYRQSAISEKNGLSLNIKADYEPKRQFKRVKIESKPKIENEPEDFEEQPDIIIKNNRGKLLQALKIPSVTKNSILQIAEGAETIQKHKKTDCEANIKRLQSLKKMKQSYVVKKSLIQSGLAHGTVKPNKKIIFNDEADDTKSNSRTNGVEKPALFEDDNVDEDDIFEANFAVKEQFEGSGGQKLLELQSRYKNDKRFNLDERFIEGDEATNEEDERDIDNDLEAEKYDQLKILEDVLGKKIVKPFNKKENIARKAMLKFDPTRPEHSNLVLKPGVGGVKAKEETKKREHYDEQELEPEVSKEIFYKIPETLKNVFAEGDTGQFSLLSAFGRTDEIEEKDYQEVLAKSIKPPSNYMNHNFFKHDSSDEENEREDIPHKGTGNKTSGQESDLQQRSARSAQSVFWTEPFFFKIDDFRLQEGFDFIEKMKISNNKEFSIVRRQVKEIVKSKIRHNERRNKMFKTKLGGSKKRKHIRMRKALNR